MLKKAKQAAIYNPSLYVKKINAANPTVTLLSSYLGSDNKILCKCNICNYRWSAFPHSLMRAKISCPECLRKSKQKPVVNLDTNETYESIVIAGKAIGISPSSISAVCKGIRITAGGYHWKYADDK